MSRLVGPEEGARSVYTITGGVYRSAAGLVATIYSDAGATAPADILTQPGGSAITGSQLTVDAYSRLPQFQYPDGLDIVYATIDGGPVVALAAPSSTAASIGAAAGLAIVFGA